jgi:hypothetical protein
MYPALHQVVPLVRCFDQKEILLERLAILLEILLES